MYSLVWGWGWPPTADLCVGELEAHAACLPYHCCLVVIVISDCGRAFRALPAFTPSVPVSCPPTAPTATAKVTDDLLIARSDRHLGALIVVALSVAFDWAEPPSAPWLALAPGVCRSLTCCAPYLLYFCRLCFLSSLWCSQGSSCMLAGVHVPMAFSSL